MRDSQRLLEAVDKPVSTRKSVNRRAVLRADLGIKKICVQIRIGVEGRVLGSRSRVLVQTLCFWLICWRLQCLELPHDAAAAFCGAIPPAETEPQYVIGAYASPR